MPGGIGSPEIIIIAVVVMVLFGAKRLPDSARALGRSMRILKAETKGLREDEKADDSPPTSALPAVAPAPAPRFDPQTGQPLDHQAGVRDRQP